MCRVGVRYGCSSKRLGEGENVVLGCIGFTGNLYNVPRSSLEHVSGIILSIPKPTRGSDI
jgi:hypothetical protein